MSQELTKRDKYDLASVGSGVAVFLVLTALFPPAFPVWIVVGMIVIWFGRGAKEDAATNAQVDKTEK